MIAMPLKMIMMPNCESYLGDMLIKADDIHGNQNDDDAMMTMCSRVRSPMLVDVSEDDDDDGGVER